MSLKQKCENAFLGVITAAGGARIEALNKFKSQEKHTVTRELPSVDAYCMGGPADSVPKMGNYKYRVVITVKTSADATEEGAMTDPAGEHAANVKAVHDAISQTDLASQLSAQVIDFHCFGVIDLGELAAKPEERAFVNAFAWEVLVCETDCT